MASVLEKLDSQCEELTQCGGMEGFGVATNLNVPCKILMRESTVKV